MRITKRTPVTVLDESNRKKDPFEALDRLRIELPAKVEPVYYSVHQSEADGCLRLVNEYKTRMEGVQRRHYEPALWLVRQADKVARTQNPWDWAAARSFMYNGPGGRLAIDKLLDWMALGARRSGRTTLLAVASIEAAVTDPNQGRVALFDHFPLSIGTSGTSTSREWYGRNVAKAVERFVAVRHYLARRIVFKNGLRAYLAFRPIGVDY